MENLSVQEYKTIVRIYIQLYSTLVQSENSKLCENTPPQNKDTQGRVTAATPLE